jgi:mRNA interferase MazF
MISSKYETGEVWVADLNPRHGTEAGKRRPVLIIQSQILLDADHPSTIILPLTTQLIKDAYPLRVRVLGNPMLETSDVMIDQIRAIDNQRLVKGPIAKISDEILKTIFNALHEIIAEK